MSLAFLFPGQGSQSLGMLADLASQYPVVEQTYARASAVLGYDLWDVVQNDQEKLNQTQVTQPALLAASYAIFQVLQQTHPELKPTAMAGHSLGEYSALTCAGVLDFEDAIALVALRGQAMQNAVPNGGAMYALLKLDEETVTNVCNQAAQETGEVVCPANSNCPGQIVIAGTVAAAEKAAELAKAAGGRAIKLAVSVPSHCPLMQPAADKLKAALDKVVLKPAQVPVLHNVNFSVAQDLDEVKQRLVEQLTGTVKWAKTIEKLHLDGYEHFLEVGPGKVLVGLQSRFFKTKVQEVNSPETLAKLDDFLS